MAERSEKRTCSPEGLALPIEREKLIGCLLGQCLGDALGFPVEGFPGSECLDYLHRQVKPWWHDRNAPSYYPFGQYTDDSQLARELLESLVENKGFEPNDYAARIERLFSEGRVVGRGIACDLAARRLSAGVPWQKAGCPPPDAGNGTAMRVAPIGLVYADDSEPMITAARTQGWITHRDSRCDAGSVAIAGAVALALRNDAEPVAFCRQLSLWVRPVHADFGACLEELPELVKSTPEEALQIIASKGKDSGHVESWPGISPFVVGSVLWSLYCFLKYPDDYFAAIWLSIAVGGDVDTTAAMTGAISGAFNGVGTLPDHLLNRLHDRGRWRRVELENLGNRAHRMMSHQSR